MFRKLHATNEDVQSQSSSCSIAIDMHLAGFSLEDTQIALQTIDRPNPAKKLPQQYYQYLLT